MSKSDTRIYVGNLPQDVRTKDIEDIFYKYGKIRYVDLKNRKGPPFAFVEFDDPRDAEDAIDGRDGYNFDGYKLRVEFQKGSRGRNGPGGSDRNSNRNGPPRRTDYRCTITGIPASGSWQDLKDHMREAGNVSFADVYKDGTGVVEFTQYEDMKWAIKNLDDTKFRSHEGETAYIRVKQDLGKRGGRSVSKSNSRSRSRSSSYSRRKRRSSRDDKERASPVYSRSNSRSPGRNGTKRKRSSRSHSKSASKSRSRSPVVRKRRDSKSSSRSRSRSRSRTPRSRSHSPRNDVAAKSNGGDKAGSAHGSPKSNHSGDHHNGDNDHKRADSEAKSVDGDNGNHANDSKEENDDE